MADTQPSVKKYYDFAQQQVDEQALLDKFNAATTAQFNLQREQNRQAENQFYNQMYNTQQTAMDTIRQSNAAAVSTGASRGVQAAQELSALLGLQQESVASATELANANRQTAQEETAAVLENVLNAYQQAEQQRQNLVTAAVQAASVDVESEANRIAAEQLESEKFISGVPEDLVPEDKVTDENTYEEALAAYNRNSQLLNNDINSLSSFIDDDWAGSSTGDAKAAEIEKNVKAYCAKYGLKYSDFEADVNYLRDVANDKASWLGAVGGIFKTMIAGSKTKTQAAADANAVLNRLREKMRKKYETKAPKKPETTTESK